MAHCAEAQGRTQEALYKFKSFANEHPDHFLIVQASFGQGRCLEILSQLENARDLYEAMLANDTSAIWNTRINDFLNRINKKIDKMNKAS